MGGLFPGGIFLGGIFPGGFFPGGIFPETRFNIGLMYFVNVGRVVNIGFELFLHISFNNTFY